MKHQGTKELETDRLFLRRFYIEDAKYMYNNWASEPEVVKYLTWQKHRSEEDSKEVLMFWDKDYDEINTYNWAIIFKEFGEPVGSITVIDIDDILKIVEIDYCIGSKFWHKGIACEAFQALIKFFFEEVGMNRVIAKCDSRNPNSAKVMEKAGMKYEGTLRESSFNNQGLCDLQVYGILAREYYSSDTEETYYHITL